MMAESKMAHEDVDMTIPDNQRTINQRTIHRHTSIDTVTAKTLSLDRLTSIMALDEGGCGSVSIGSFQGKPVVIKVSLG